MEFKIENTEVYGLNKSIIASGNAMRVEMDDNLGCPGEKDFSRATKLAATKPGEGHDNFLNGIIVQFDLYAPLYMWKQIQRYHFMDFVSSQSTMHRLTKFDVFSQCVEDTDPLVLQRVQHLIDEYNNFNEEYKDIENDVVLNFEKRKKWRTIVASLPCGFVLGATMTTNYRQLKTIFAQRRFHKLYEWHEFCDWIKSLPHSYLITGEKEEQSDDLQK
jgi:hypothetical protein